MRYIYKITNKVSGKIYIGQTNDAVKRWKDHLSAVRNNFGFLLHSSIRKHGTENFIFEVIEECEDIATNDREKFWISYYDSFHNGYNLTSGGDHDFNRSDETINKMSKSYQRHYRHINECIIIVFLNYNLTIITKYWDLDLSRRRLNEHR